MTRNTVRCLNMNHGRLNVPVKFCPTCGEPLNRMLRLNCTQDTHASLRKDRHHFCTACGKDLQAK